MTSLDRLWPNVERLAQGEELESLDTQEASLAFSHEFRELRIESNGNDFLAIGSVGDIIALGVLIAVGVNANEMGKPDMGLNPDLLSEDDDLRFFVLEAYTYLNHYSFSERSGKLLEELEKPGVSRDLDRDGFVKIKVEGVEGGDNHTMALRILPSKYAKGEERPRVVSELKAVIQKIVESRKGISFSVEEAAKGNGKIS